MITSTSPRFKKFLSPSILLNFRRNFTKYVIKLFNSNNLENLFPHVFWWGHWLHFGTNWYRVWFWHTFDSIQTVKLIFKCSKSTSKKYDFKKSNTHFSSPWVLDYTCKKVEWSVEPDYQKYPSFMAMSGCQNKRSILKDSLPIVKFHWKSIIFGNWP